MKTILVTGIGGNVGQGVAKVLKSVTFPESLRVIGCDVKDKERCAGTSLCDEFLTVPSAISSDYLRSIPACDLIIPTTDIECCVLAAAQDLGFSRQLPYAAVSKHSLCDTFYDKYATYLAFRSNCAPFARTWPGQDMVIKPRRGNGARGFSVVGDPSTCVQERLLGPEITISTYCTRDGFMNGWIAFERELDRSGSTAWCRTVREPELQFACTELVHGTMTRFGGLRGSCNIQAMWHNAAELIPFEVNCRFSGTVAIRHIFGYTDVVWAVEEHLFGIAPAPPKLRSGSAHRISQEVYQID